MAAKMSITLGSGFSVLCGVMWIIAIAAKMTWLRSDNAIVSFKVNLYSVDTSQGVGTAVLTGISNLVAGPNKFSQAISKFIDGNMPIEQAKQSFCVITLFNWCDMWEKAWMASWIMVILGFTAAAFFIAGGITLYYYGNVHATETGRCMTKCCVLMGPFCGLCGIAVYTFLTMEFGKSSDPILQMGSHSYWGEGWIIGITVTVLSWIPAYILAMFCNADPFEKKHGEGEDAFLEYGNADHSNMQYGATNMQGGGYVAGAGQPILQPMPQPVSAPVNPSFGLPATNAPGYGAPAW